MKKSEMYQTAQIAILNEDGLQPKYKLAILAELMTQEKLCKHFEEQEEEKKNAET